MKNTQDFRKALEEGNLNEAESFLKKVADNPEGFPNYDDRWLDHRQRELFQSYYRNEDWVSAKRIVEDTKDPKSQEGRKARLEELSGIKYEDI